MNNSGFMARTVEKHLRNLPRERFSLLRALGYAIYCSWVLASFYCTFLYLSAPDFRSALYLHMFVSLAALVMILFVAAKFVKRVDKWVLSRRFIYAATVILGLSTVGLIVADPASQFGFSLIIGLALLTGISSGILFLGWARLFTDAGTRISLVEISLSWFSGAMVCLVLTFLPTAVSAVFTVILGVSSGVFLRACTLQRPPRPEPQKPHALHPHTKKMFTRGFFAAVNFGFVAGFADVISGFRFFSISDHYGMLLLIGVGVMSLAAIVITAVIHRNTVIYVHRLAFFTLALGCLSIPFMSNNMTYPNIIILGGYICYGIVLFAIAIDISNYFDISAVKAVGYAFAALYAGELLGAGSAHLITLIPSTLPILNLITFFLIGALIFANIFLFTEKDIAETHLGEMIDSDEENYATDSDKSLEPLHIQTVCSRLVETYGLTAREADVLPLIIKGRTIARMQEELFISAGTVSTHVRHIYQKIGVKNRQALLDLIEEQVNVKKSPTTLESGPKIKDNQE